MLHTLVWSLALQLESGNHVDLWSYPNQDVGDCVTLLIGPLIGSYPAFLAFNFVTNCTFMRPSGDQHTGTPCTPRLYYEYNPWTLVYFHINMSQLKTHKEIHTLTLSNREQQ